MGTHKTVVRKYHGGGLGDLGDPNIPEAAVQVYIRDRNGATFYVSSFEEGLAHLFSNEGYRLTIKAWPDGAGFGRPEYAIVIWRDRNELHTEVRAPFLKFNPGSDTVEFELDRKPVDPNKMGSIKVISLNEVLGLPSDEQGGDNNVEVVDVEIDGS